jgi:hypothetical protein
LRTTHDVSLDSHSAQRSLPSRCRTAAHRLNCSPLDVVTVPIGTVVHIHVKKAISARRTTTGPWRHSVEGADLPQPIHASFKSDEAQLYNELCDAALNLCGFAPATLF